MTSGQSEFTLVWAIQQQPIYVWNALLNGPEAFAVVCLETTLDVDAADNVMFYAMINRRIHVESTLSTSDY